MDEVRELTLADIMDMFRRRKWTLILITFLTLVLTGVYLFYFATPEYEAKARVKVTTTKGMSFGFSIEALLSGGGLKSGSVSNEIELLTSRTNILKVIKELDLVEKLIAPESLKKMKEEGLTLEQIQLILADNIKENLLNVSPVKDTNIIEVTFTWKDPDLAASITNALVQGYVEMSEKLSKTQIQSKREFIEKKIPEVEAEMNQAQEALKKFKERNRIYLVDEQSKLLLNKLADLETKIESIEMQLDAQKQMILYYKTQLKGLDEETASMVDNLLFDPIVSELRTNLVQLRIEYAGLLEEYTEDSPVVMRKKKEIEETEKALKEETRKVIASRFRKMNNQLYSTVLINLIEAQSQVNVLKTQLEALNSIYKNIEKQLSKLPALEQELINLEREYRVKEAIYTQLLQSYNETLISEAAVTAQVSVIDSAVPPVKPTKPNKKLTLAIGFVLGIFLGILGVFYAEFKDPTIKSISDVEFLVGEKKILEMLPIEKGDQNIRRIKSLATTFVEEKILAITSPSDKEGKTYLAKNLAKVYSRYGERTVLLTKENVMKEEYDVYRISEYTKPSELKNIMDDLKNEYDKIIVDAGGITTDPDSKILINSADAIIIVVRLRKTHFETFKYALNILEKFDGVVINGVERKKLEI